MSDNSYGLHLTLRVADIRDTAALDDQEVIASFLVSLVHRINMRILAGPLVTREPGAPEKRGCSGVIILYESHAAIHTYPALGAAFVDVFSCRSFSVDTIVDVLNDYFGHHRIVELVEQERGLHWSGTVRQHMEAWTETR